MHALGTPPALVLSQDQTLHPDRLCTSPVLSGEWGLPRTACPRSPRSGCTSLSSYLSFSCQGARRRPACARPSPVRIKVVLDCFRSIRPDLPRVKGGAPLFLSRLCWGRRGGDQGVIEMARYLTPLRLAEPAAPGPTWQGRERRAYPAGQGRRAIAPNCWLCAPWYVVPESFRAASNGSA